MKSPAPWHFGGARRIPSACLCGILASFPCFTQAEDEAIPRPYPPERYESIWKKSPFTLSSAAPETVAGFAENLMLVGVVKIGGESYVAVLNKATQKRELISRKPNPQGIFLARLESGDEMDKVAATLQKGTETSVMRYDTAFLKSFAAKPAPGEANPGGAPAAGASPSPQPGPGAAANQATPPPPRVRHSRMIPSQSTASPNRGTSTPSNAPKQSPGPTSSKP